MERKYEFLVLNKLKKPLFHTTLDSLLESPIVRGSSSLFLNQLLLNIAMMEKGDIIKVDFEKNTRWDALIETSPHMFLKKTED